MKFLFLFIIFFILLFVLSVFASDDYFCFTKLGNSESVPSVVNSISNNLICKNGECTCHLSSGEGYCLVCTNSSGWYAGYNECNSDYCAADPNENVSLELDVNFPFKNNEFLSKNRFFVEVSSTKLAKIDLINNLNGEKKNLCMHCSSFSKTMGFKEGLNNMTLKAYSKGELKKKEIVFFIDTKKPRIIKISPSQGKYSDGYFNISYNENNLRSIKLYYGTKNNTLEKELVLCKNGKEECSVKVDLSKFENQKIIYWFEVNDFANNSVLSSKYNIFVDSKKPVLKNISYSISGNYVNFVLAVDEVNLYKILYSENEKRQSVLCSSLKNGICSRKISFSQGYHEVNFEIIDRAGNVFSKLINFEMK